MARPSHSLSKRQREAEKARKKRDKAERLRRNRQSSSEGIPVASVEELQPVAMNAPMPDPAANENIGVADTSGPPCRLFVGGLNWDTHVTSLRAFFHSCGEVVDATIVTDRDTGQSRGFGFVTMADRKAGARAVKELDGLELDGRAVRVNLATERGR